MGIGALVFIGGALLYGANKTTKVDQDLGAKQAAVLLPGLWRTPGSSTAVTERKILPGVMGIPILSGRF